RLSRRRQRAARSVAGARAGQRPHPAGAVGIRRPDGLTAQWLTTATAWTMYDHAPFIRGVIMSRDWLEQNQVSLYFVAVAVAAIAGLTSAAFAGLAAAAITPAIAVL